MDSLILTIILGTITLDGSAKLVIADFMDKPLWASSSNGQVFISISFYLCLPIMLIDGYCIGGSKGLVIIIAGWLLMRIIINMIRQGFSADFRPNLPGIQFIIVGPIYLLFSIYIWLFY